MYQNSMILLPYFLVQVTQFTQPHHPYLHMLESMVGLTNVIHRAPIMTYMSHMIWLVGLCGLLWLKAIIGELRKGVFVTSVCVKLTEIYLIYLYLFKRLWSFLSLKNV